MTGSEVAVIGMAVRLPGASSLDAFWTNLRDGVCSIRTLTEVELLAAGESPELLRDPAYVRANSAPEGIDRFDAGFFGFSPQDAAVMDPQHRITLELGWEALENAGHVPGSFRGSVGVFATCGMNSYMMYNLVRNREVMETVGEWLVRHTGNDPNFLATRLSYELNLTGPSMNVQAACSSALVAIHLAAQSLLSGECDMALAGGCTINFPHDRGYVYRPGEILSPDGLCRAFDARAAGIVFASGGGMVVLRRLEDALADRDRVAAVILGSAVNNDGSLRAGYLAPGVEGQSRVVAEALAAAGAGPETISMLEAHGTGTRVGDPIEIAAITQAYRRHTSRRGFCALGSLKSNIGHLGEAAGVAGFIKAVLSLQNGQIPPTLHFESPNPQIDFPASPFFVNTQLRDWSAIAGPRRAAVTSLGGGGTNCHVILEQAPGTASSGPSRPWQLLTLSAGSPAALDEAAANLASHLQTCPDVSLADVAYTLNIGRKAFAHRRAIVASGVADAIAALQPSPRTTQAKPESVRDSAEPTVAFLFPGQGPQYPGMGRELYRHQRVFREELDRCGRILKPHLDLDLREALYGPGDPEAMRLALEQTALTQPALFAVEYATAKLWMSWGVKPRAMLGHSLGEYVAACLAGVFTLEDALALVAARGRLMQQAPRGAMLAVPLASSEAERLMNGLGAAGLLSLAAVNGPDLSVIAGSHQSVEAFANTLSSRGIAYQRLHTSHAFHSPMMDSVLDSFRRRVQASPLAPPSIPFISNVTGTWIRDEEATDPEYWVRHARQAVRFSDGAATLLDTPSQVLLEAGPGSTLSGLAQLQPVKPVAAVPSLPRASESVSDLAFLLNSCGRLWSAGVPLDWRAYWADERRCRVALPAYPFQRQSYWIHPDRTETDRSANLPAPAAAGLHQQPDVADWFYLPSWKRAVLPPAGSQPRDKRAWLVFMDETGLGDALVERLARAPQASVEEPLPLRLQLAEPGEIESLAWMPVERRTPGPGEVEIRVRASALNFGDILKVTGAYPGAIFGIECAGVITAVGKGVKDLRVGDEVVAIGPESHATYVIRDARLVARKPELLTFEEAVTLPASYVTAWYALHHVAGLKRGEKILIHAASGGVGLAAVEIARRIGAEVFATAGNHEKRAYLESLGIRHVYDSRTLDFAARCEEATSGVGVDVVLNSLTGEFIPKGLCLLAAGGRFVELGKKELWAADRLSALPLKKGVSYLPVDLIQLLKDDPSRYGAVLREVVESVRGGDLHALPRRVFPMIEADAAFRHILATRHIGKVVLSIGPAEREFFLVRAGHRFERLSEREFTVDPSREDAYSMLLQSLGSAAGRIDGVLHLWNTEADGSSQEPLEKYLERGFFSLTRLAKALAQQQPANTVEINVISHRVQSVAGETEVEPAKATLLGACRTVPREFPNLQCRSIDVNLPAPGTRQWEQLLEQLPAEVVARPCDRAVAYRGPSRWIQTFEQVSIASAAPHTGLVDRGVYVVTGDSAEAFEFAESLAKGIQARLVLLCSSHPPAKPVLKNWQASGAETVVETVDLTSANEMRDAIRRAQARFGALDGVFYEGPAGMREKIRSAAALAAALEGMSPGFLVLLSSTSSLVGLPGRAEAAAADTFLHAFAQQRAQLDAVRTLAVAWPGQLDTTGSIDILSRILSCPAGPQVAVSPVDLSKRMLDDDRAAQPLQTLPQAPASPVSSAGPSAPRNTGSIEQTLAGMFSRILGVESPGFDEEFFDLGGHSLLLYRLSARIERCFKKTVPLAFLFESATINRIARFLREDGMEGSKFVVPFNDRASGPPFFAIHNIAGEVGSLRFLARSLDKEQRFYGIQVPPQYINPQFPTSVEAVAGRYADEILAAEPQGPYIVGGWSAGSPLAFEVARQLEARGQHVELIVAMDGMLCNTGAQTSQWNPVYYARLAWNVPRWVRDNFLPSFTWRGFTKRLVNKVQTLTARGVATLRGDPDASRYTVRGMFAGADVPELDFAFMEALYSALCRYVPKPYRGRAVLYQAKTGPLYYLHESDKTWRKMAPGVDVVYLPGTHITLLDESHVERLVRDLNPRLRECRERVRAAAVRSRDLEQAAGANLPELEQQAPKTLAL
jgi:acyl transferase domain-containing protein/thioesterase domain-containing protein/NADPH-dependent curcumin reductase CurA